MVRTTSGCRTGGTISGFVSGEKCSLPDAALYCISVSRPFADGFVVESKREPMLGEGVARGEEVDAESEIAGVRGEGLSSLELRLWELA